MSRPRHLHLHPDTGMIRLPCMTRVAFFYGGRYPSPTERDRRSEWQTRLHDLQRQNSPRQRRKREEYRALLASRREIIENILGAIVLGILILIAAFA